VIRAEVDGYVHEAIFPIPRSAEITQADAAAIDDDPGGQRVCPDRSQASWDACLSQGEQSVAGYKPRFWPKVSLFGVVCLRHFIGPERTKEFHAEVSRMGDILGGA
jgi:hypothetical protein